jgi:rhodanese-related sulfurtransferase
MKQLRWKVVLFAVALVIIASTASAYDETMAKSYEQYFEAFEGKATGKALQLMGAADFVDAAKAGEDMFVLDIRTSPETEIYGITIPGAVAIPMNEVFKPENLARIPDDRKVVVVCRGGIRAAVIATGLRHIGFADVYVLHKGTMALADYLTPSKVN